MRLATIAANVKLEEALQPRPTRLMQVPPSSAALTREWLTAALCKDAPGAEVVEFRRGGETIGSTSRSLLSVTYDDAGRDAGLPPTVFTKAAETFQSRVVTGIQGAAANECVFYGRLRPGLDMLGPRAYHAAFNRFSCRSMLLLEDVARTRAARFGGAGELYVDRGMAESQMRELAALHAPFWNSAAFAGELARFSTSREFYAALEAVGFEGGYGRGIDRAADVMPAELLARRDELFPGTLRSFDLHAEGPLTLAHADTHLGNWFATPDGQMGLFDWHCLVKGSWALDVVYALSSALTTEDRRAWERDLVRIYLGHLGERGVRAPDFESAWLTYRQQPFHALAWWLFPLGAKPDAEDGDDHSVPDMQTDEICRTNIARIAQAMVDLESLDSLATASRIQMAA